MDILIVQKKGKPTINKKNVNRVVKERLRGIKHFDRNKLHEEIVRLFLEIPGIVITISNKAGEFYNAVLCLSVLKQRIIENCPGIKIHTNTLIKFKVEVIPGLYSILRVEYRFVRPSKEISYIVGEELQSIDQKTFNKMIDAESRIFAY